jgi:hypothetical protein
MHRQATLDTLMQVLQRGSPALVRPAQPAAPPGQPLFICQRTWLCSIARRT